MSTRQKYQLLGGLALVTLMALALPHRADAQFVSVQGERVAQPNEADRIRGYYQRGDTLLNFFADQVPADDYSRGGYFNIVANLVLDRNAAWNVARLDSLMQDPRGDMFWMYPFITVMYAGRDQLPEATRAQMRDLWRTYTPYRGDTENHWLMFHAAMYLVTQMYPDEPAESWFNGKSSEENFREAEEYLISWYDLTTTIGQGEYDSPDYFNVYIVPNAQLLAYAEDPAMRLRAKMMLDYLLADFAVESLNGIYTGAHSRVYPRQALETWFPASTGFAWLLFGNTPQRLRAESMLLLMAGYEPSAWLHALATDRSRDYIHKERKRTRHRMRFSPGVRNAPVYKYTYMTPEFSVGTSQGGLLQPIQQKTWEVNWALDDPRNKNNTFFTIHPHSSTTELGMYFSGTLGFLTEGVTRSKTTYDSPDKWTGGSPYEQVFQDHGAVIALYDIKPDTRWPHVAAFFSKDLAHREDDDSGWVFAQGGDALIAVYPMAPYEWRREEDEWQAGEYNYRLHSPHLKNGFVVQVASASSFEGGFEGFKSAVRALDLDTSVDPLPSVSFTTLDGTRLTAAYGSTPTVDGRAVEYDNWKLFEGPFLNAEVGSRRLEISYGIRQHTLDFGNLQLTDDIADRAPMTGPAVN